MLIACLDFDNSAANRGVVHAFVEKEICLVTDEEKE
jgi:hypothetical protein